ncbi:MAG: nucleotidyltransferase family protein [Anaerolineae bacterium]|nr:nucleotidyltransferase family protein [Anaerolineae bacterium]
MTEATKSRFGIDDLLSDKRAEILRLAHKHGASNVRVFGSVARGEADEDSDVDFLVDWDYTRISPWGGAGLFEELESLLGRRVDIATESQLRPGMKARILKDSVAL